VEYLKIDGSFVRDMAKDPINTAMVESINEIGHIMGLKTIAEFVENEFINEKLKKLKVDFVQGYAIHKPEPFNLHSGVVEIVH
jgi:EAL domain-containing protein (putative c-di-GMP-specific phosphodiesterase class I)